MRAGSHRHGNESRKAAKPQRKNTGGTLKKGSTRTLCAFAALRDVVFNVPVRTRSVNMVFSRATFIIGIALLADPAWAFDPPAPELAPIELTLVDDHAIGYGTFQS